MVKEVEPTTAASGDTSELHASASAAVLAKAWSDPDILVLILLPVTMTRSGVRVKDYYTESWEESRAQR
jgi:hypothetical protein